METSVKSLAVVLIFITLGSAYFTASRLIEFSHASRALARAPTLSTSTQTNGPAGVARWETLQGSGFSLKHPPEWMVKKSGNTTFLIPDAYAAGCLDGSSPDVSSQCVYLKIVPKSDGVTYGIGSGKAITADTLQEKYLGGHAFSFIDQKFEGVRFVDYFLRVQSAALGYMQFRYGERYVDAPGVTVPVTMLQTAEKILSTITFPAQ